MAGAALLAMLGSSGERTDLGSHLFGLLSGLVIGLFIALKPLKQLRQSPFMQIAFFITAISRADFVLEQRTVCKNGLILFLYSLWYILYDFVCNLRDQYLPSIGKNYRDSSKFEAQQAINK